MTVGSVPEGWSLHVLAAVAAVQVGGPMPKETEGNGPSAEVRVVRPADLHSRRVTSSHTVRVADGRIPALDRYRLKPGDILVTRTGTVGRTALVTQEEEGWVYTNHLIRVRPAAVVEPAFLAAHLARPAVLDWLLGRASGSAIKSLTTAALAELPLALPPADEQVAMGRVLAALDRKIRAHEETVRATDELRRSLGELLMTGRLPVSPA